MKIPAGFGHVTPYIFATHADAYVEFLKGAFGAVEIGRSIPPDGAVANCQLQMGTSILMLSEATEAFPPSASAFYLFVEDADAAMKRAIAQGATMLMAARNMDYGDRQGGVRDRSGNIWWISQRLTDEGYF